MQMSELHTHTQTQLSIVKDIHKFMNPCKCYLQGFINIAEAN